MSGIFDKLELRQLDVRAEVAEVARDLRNLPGLVFYDSAGNLGDSENDAVSVIGARPTAILTGHISDPERLERELAKWSGGEGTGLPAGALCGWVDYEGGWCFGVYPELLIFRHADRSWWSIGNLWEERRKTQAPEPETGDWKDSLGREKFIHAVRQAQELIAAGDIYQVNLSRRLSAPVSGPGDFFELYDRLRTASPAPFSAYLNLAGREILSSSPEAFLKMDGRKIETRPIKGTRPRTGNPKADRLAREELQSSDKERAELVMITDLERNDLGRVCEFGEVRVTRMLEIEQFEQVFHLVSTVEGRLRENVSHPAALASCFPGGSITGAPKKRAMEIIADLEPVKRGLYTGAVGWFGFNGVSQFCIAIRTLVHEKKTLSYGVGAGIVADSVPEAEFEETEQKALGIRLALAGRLPETIVFFDGDCGLCLRSVRLLDKLDPRDRLRFAPLEGKTAQRLGTRLPTLENEGSVIVFKNGQATVRSEAVREALRATGRPGSLAATALGLVPLPLREAAYRWVAARRLRFFGTAETCGLPSPNLRKKILL